MVFGQAKVIRKHRYVARDLDARVSAISQQLVNFDVLCERVDIMNDWLNHQFGQARGCGS